MKQNQTMKQTKKQHNKVYDPLKKKYVNEKRDYGALSTAGDKYGKKYVIYVFLIFTLALVGAIYLIILLGGFLIGLI